MFASVTIMRNVMPVRFEGQHREAICAIRERVFVDEQGVPAELEYDGLDPAAQHVLAWVDGEAVGTGRVLDDGHIGRIAVLPAWRGQGVGAEIVQALIEQAARAGCTRVYLGAQVHAVGFYQQLGFSVHGEPFMDAGILHRHMDKVL